MSPLALARTDEEPELSEADALAMLQSPAPEVPAPDLEPELSDEEALQALSGKTPKMRALSGAPPELGQQSEVVPKRAGVLREFAGGALENLASIPEFGAETTWRLRGALGQSTETPLLDAAAGGLRGLAQEVYPAEKRGRGGLSEQLSAGGGAILATGPFMAAGAIPSAIALGAQTAMPLYYDTLAATGDREAATWNLLFGFGVGQLERFGAEKAAGSLVRKLATGKLGEAVERSLIAQVGGGALGESATEVAQQGLSDALLEAFTDEDVANWERMKETLPPALLLGGAFHVVDGALQKPMAKELAHTDSAKGGKLAPDAENQGTAPGGQPVPDVPAGGPKAAPQGAVLPPVPAGQGPGPDVQPQGAAEGAPQGEGGVQRAPQASQGKQAPLPGVQEPQGVGVPPQEGGRPGAGTAPVLLGEEEGAAPGGVAVPEAPHRVAEAPEVQGEAGAAEAAPDRRRELTRRKAHELTAAEAEEALGLQEEHERTADVRALGEEGAREWNRLQRQQNSTSQKISDKAAKRIAEIEATLTKEQQDALYGVGEEGMGAEDLRELSSELNAVSQAQSEAELGRIVAKSLADVRQGDPETFQPGTKEALAAARLAEAGRTIAAKGFDSEKVTKAALSRARELYGDDAPELLRRWMPKAKPEVAAMHVASSRKDATPVVESKPVTPSLKAEPDEGTIQMFGGLPPLRENTPGITKARVKKAGKALYEGLIKTHGGKPEAAALMEERARGEIEVAASKAKGAVKAVKRAIRRHNRTASTKITNATLQEALTSPDALAKLPDSVRPQVEKMRALADDLSRIMVNEGMTSETMSEVIEGRMGEYLRRSYKAHQDPAWAEKVPLDVRNRLESLLVSWAEPLTEATKKRLQATAFKDGRPQTMEQREAHFELRSRRKLQGKKPDEIRAEMSAMLQDAKRVAENPWAAFAKSKLKRQDVSLFKARKGLPEEMRAFLGEEKDPYANYTNTILKQASYVATHRKFREMRSEGLDNWLFEKPTVRDGIEYTTRVSVEDNPRLAPLVGDKPLYTTERIKKALFDVDRSLANKWWRAVVVANSILKGTKTIYQVYAVPKQAASQIAALVRNGHIGYALRHPRKIMEGMWGIGEEGQKLREELIRLQVLDTSLAAAEFKDVQEIMSGRRLNEPYRSLAQANDWIAAAFSQPDNFSKTAGYLKELDWLEQIGIKGERAKRQAADTVKNVYPTYGRIVEWVKHFRRQPIVGTFVAFKAEQVRTRVEQLRLIGRELKSANPKERALGRRRAVAMLAGLSIAPAGAAAWNMLNGIDQEEDERRRRKVSEYDRERNLAWIGDDEYTDLSDIDDGSWVTDPLMRILAGADAEDVLKELWRENAKPFVELSLFSEALAEWSFGRTKYGKPIENDWEWFKEKVQPSSWKNLDLRDLTGFRVRKQKSGR